MVALSSFAMSSKAANPIRFAALAAALVAVCGVAMLAAGRPAFEVGVGLVLMAGGCAGVTIWIAGTARDDSAWRARVEKSLGGLLVGEEATLGLKCASPDAAAEILAGELVRLGDVSRRERAKILRLLDGVGVPVFATDRTGAIVLVNTSAGAMFQGRGLPLAGRRVEDVFTQLEIVELHQRASGGNAEVSQVRLVRDGSPRQFEVAATPWQTEGEADGAWGVVLTLRDVTEAAAAAQLKTDFVASASHEFRTPLTAIKGAVETLQGGAHEDAVVRVRFIDMIGMSVSRLEDLTRDLLDLSRLESPEAVVQRSMVDAGRFVRGIAGQFGLDSAARNISMEVEVSPRCDSIRTDPRLLELVLRNLIENAVKFASEGTAVRVTIAPGPIAASVRCQVVDRGIGIPIDQQQRIFERFYQVDSSRQDNGPKGTGLGLSIVKYAVRTLGGVIRVDSVWGQGTTMTVDLPDAMSRRVESEGVKEVGSES